MLNVPYTITVAAKRRTTVFGESQWAPIAPIEVSYALDAPQPIQAEGSGRYTQSGMLFTDRGVDLRDGDKVALPEGVFDPATRTRGLVEFGVVAYAQWDFVHPMTGYDFGKAVFHIQREG